MFRVPPCGRGIGVGIGTMSCRGMATLAVMADAHRVSDPESITGRFGRECAAPRRRTEAAHG